MTKIHPALFLCQYYCIARDLRTRGYVAEAFKVIIRPVVSRMCMNWQMFPKEVPYKYCADLWIKKEIATNRKTGLNRDCSIQNDLSRRRMTALLYTFENNFPFTTSQTNS